MARATGSDRALRNPVGMATVTVNRPDILGISNTAKIYAAGSEHFLAGTAALPGGSIASGTTDSAGSLTITDAALSSLTRYVVAAVVGGTVQCVKARSTLDVEDKGVAAGTA